jgi:hypothetical protein
MQSESNIAAYLINLDRQDEELAIELVRHAQLHQLYPNAGHQISWQLTERKLLAIRAKAAALAWILESYSDSIPKD